MPIQFINRISCGGWYQGVKYGGIYFVLELIRASVCIQIGLLRTQGRIGPQQWSIMANKNI